MSCCSASRTAASPPPVLTDPAVPADAPERTEAAAQFNEDVVAALPGGTFWMGSEDEDVNPYDGEGPVRQVEVAPFSISRYAVTNQDFSRFVDQTG